MEQRFKTRELCLFAPILLMMAAAFYWMRAEKVEPPNPQGITVSDFKIEPSPGLWQSEGFSHQITVTLSYKGARPKWWGNATTHQTAIDAFDTKDFHETHGGANLAHWLAFGSTLTYRREGKTLAWAPPAQTYSFNGHFLDDRYVFVHQVSLAQAPQKLGAIGFRGLYVIGEQEPFVVTRTLRAAGETVSMPANEGTGIQLLRVDATPFFQMQSVAASGKKQKSDLCYVRFTLRDFDAPPASEKLPTFMFSDIELGDESAEKLETNTGNGLDWGMSEEGKDQKLLNGQRQGVLFVEMAPNFKLNGRLKCKGKISIGTSQPVAFEVMLPPRQSKPQIAGGFDNFSVPLWRNGKPIKP